MREHVPVEAKGDASSVTTDEETGAAKVSVTNDDKERLATGQAGAGAGSQAAI
jgi:hypothetical protein